LHALPSVHDEPLGSGVVVQPKTGSQLSVVQGFASLQLSGGPAVQAPPWQVSSPLQMLPSVQDAPLGSTPLVQAPAVQVSTVHGLPSAQSAATAQGWQPGMGLF
jgi:hypothetical protein